MRLPDPNPSGRTVRRAAAQRRRSVGWRMALVTVFLTVGSFIAFVMPDLDGRQLEALFPDAVIISETPTTERDRLVQSGTTARIAPGTLLRCLAEPCSSLPTLTVPRPLANPVFSHSVALLPRAHLVHRSAPSESPAPDPL